MKKQYIYAFAALFTLGVTGCELGDFGDTNVNPNATTEANPGALLTNAAAQLGDYASMTRPGLYAQYFSQTQYTDVSLYSAPQLDFVGNYSGPLNNLQTVINLNTTNNMNQVAKIMQQYIFWTITDRWGDVPYSEALQALENPSPTYDPQERIYKGMIDTLAAAVDAMDNSAITGDIVFGGNVDAWKRTANSLRMLMALRLSERYPEAGGYAATQFNAALNHPAGYISTNAQNFALDYPGGNFMNPWFSLYNGRRDYAQSAFMTSLMANLGDTRQLAFGGANDLRGQANSEETSNIGVPYGLARADAEAFTSANTNWARVLRGDFRRDNSELVIIGAGHVALARAEAAALGWTSEDVSAVYREGIRLSHERWGVPVSDNYFSQNNVMLTSGGSSEEDYRKIAIQRYIAFYPDGLQGWSVWRKTGYPQLTPAPAASGRQIPLRYTYSPTERSTNAGGVAEAEARLQPQGGDIPTASVWWDVD